MKNQTKKKLRIGVLAIVILIAAGGAAFYSYTLDYYRATGDVETWIQQYGDRIQYLDDLTVVYPDASQDLEIGLIFYPGGKVEAKAYLPLLSQLSDEGLTCVMPKMPFNLAVFNSNAADDIYGQIPEIKKWFLSGHSLGGAMASRYVEESAHKVEGLLLLGAYPINNTELPTYAIYGTFDIKLNLEKLESTESFEIVGGNHAYFGNYGEQEGDGTAVITREGQQKVAVDEIMGFIRRLEN